MKTNHTISLKIMTGKCQKCDQSAEYNFGEFGAQEVCIFCGAAPIFVRKEIKYRYVKISIGSQKGYKVYFNDELIGHVISDWAKVMGGDCWSFEIAGQRYRFATRREASHRLRKLKEMWT